MTPRNFNPEMLTLVRELRGMTQRQLAEAAGFSQGLVSQVEASTRDFSDEGISKIAKVLKIPTKFFFQDEAYSGFGISMLFYRKRASALVGHLRRLQAEVNIRRIHAKKLLRGVDISTKNSFEFLDIEEHGGSPEDVAIRLRATWSLPIGPIKNLVATIENAGGIVFRFPFGTADVDAMSQWPDDSPPLFFLNSDASADRVRFSLAHELGHVVMHRTATEDIESQADRFASEFMMPKQDIAGDLLGMNLHRAAALKPYWRMSMASLIRRARDLGKITEVEYRDLFIKMGQLGMRKKEPSSFPGETPSLIPQLFGVYLKENGFTMDQIADLLCWPEEDLSPMYLPTLGLRMAQ